MRPRGDRRHARRRTTKGRRLVAAGQVLGVGLVCFATWLVLDARQLYTSSLAAPLGARRSVAVAILRPIARATEALGLDRPVREVDRLVGRGATPGGSAAPAVATPGGLPAAARTASPVRAHPLGTTVAQRATAQAATAPTAGTQQRRRRVGPTRPGLPPLVQPRPGHVLTILDVGDSIGEDLGIGLGNLLGGDPWVRVLQDAVGSTGLAAVGYYNWPVELEKELETYHPKLVVVMLGGNDAQSFDVGSTYVGFGTPLWRSVYSRRVATMMDEATSAGAHVLWVGMPIMSPQSVLSNTDMQLENTVYASEARHRAGVAFMSTWRLLATPTGQYSEYLPDASGNLVQVRDPDGVHVDAPGGTDLLAAGVVREIERVWHIRL